MNSKILIKRYILLNIYLGKWKPGDKILSAQQMSIKFNVSLSTVKKELINFKNNNILTAHLRKGFFINENLFKLVPLSIREKYGFEKEKVSLEIIDDHTILKKEYSSDKTDSDIWVDSTVFSTVFKKSKYLENETFMYNLAWNGIVVSSIHTSYKIRNIKDKKYLIEKRRLFDIDDNLVVEEKLYIPYEVWFDQEEFRF